NAFPSWKHRAVFAERVCANSLDFSESRRARAKDRQVNFHRSQRNQSCKTSLPVRGKRAAGVERFSPEYSGKLSIRVSKQFSHVLRILSCVQVGRASAHFASRTMRS